MEPLFVLDFGYARRFFAVKLIKGNLKFYRL